MYMYVQRPGCKKVNTSMYVHTGRVSNAYSRICTARACVHGRVGTEKLRRCRVHGEATECVVFIGRQRNVWEPTGLDKTGDGKEAWHTAKQRKRPCVRPATFEMGSFSSRGVWHTAKWGKHTCVGPPTVKTGSYRSGGVWRTAKWRKRTCVGALRSKRGSCSSGGV